MPPRQTRSSAVSAILYYANVQTTDQNWRKVIWGPDAARLIGPIAPNPGPIFGVPSRQRADEILSGFRSFLGHLVQGAKDDTALRTLLGLLFDRARLQPQALVLNSEVGTIFVSWATENASFEESLYARLVLALEEIPARRIRRCAECEAFFFKAHDRPLRYCGRRCRNRTSVRRYRYEHQGEHREYQRKLMKRRRANQQNAAGESDE